MPLIDLPFLQGQDATRESKIAPLGVLKTARNVRFTRDGRVVKRPATESAVISVYDGTTISSGVQAIASRGDEKVLVANSHLYSNTGASPGVWRDWGILPDVGAPERREVGRNKAASCIDGSVAVVGSPATWIAAIYSANGQIFATIYDATMGEIRDSSLVSPFALSQVRPRIMALGTTLVAMWLSTSGTYQLMVSTFNTASPSATWSAPAVAVSPVYNGHTYWDAAPYSASKFLLVAQSDATHIDALTCDATGAVTGGVSIVANGYPTTCGTPSEYASIAWFDPATKNIRIQSFPGSGANPYGGAAVGPTTLFNSTTTRGPITIARSGSTKHTLLFSRNVPTAGSVGDSCVVVQVFTATHATTNVNWNGVRLASKLFYRGSQQFFLGVNESNFERVYCLNSRVDNSGAPDTRRRVLQTTLARGEAPAYTTPGQSEALSEVVNATIDGVDSLVFAIPVIVSGSVASGATPSLGMDLAIVPFRQASSERLQTAQLGGCLYLTGGLLSIFDGRQAHELGFQTSQNIVSLTSSNAGGSMPNNGVYQYVLTREWYDAQGQRHISGVSDPVSVTLGATHNRVDVAWNPNIQSNRGSLYDSSVPNAEAIYIRTHVWRTLNGGSIFYRVTPEDGLPIFVSSSDVIQTFADTAADATIRTNPVVYTQGTRGGLSGPLQHDPPPPCRYIWLGKDRGIIGGLEHPDEVRWTKQFFAGEPLEFSEELAFRKRVHGSVTAVACLDGSWVVFTKERIFAIFGDGPDDSGNGSFTDAQAVPSEVGCIEARSLVETPAGLFFQARANAIYLLPRGLGAPIWIGHPVRDVMEAYGANARVTSAVLHREWNVVVFTLWNGSSVTPRSTSLVYDLRTNQWTTDQLFAEVVSGTAGYIGATTWGGVLNLATEAEWIREVPAATATGVDGTTAYSMVLETHALRPGGMQADVRTRKMAALAEYQGASLLQYELATDDGTTYPYSVNWLISGLTVGGQVRTEWRLPAQKFGSFRLRVTDLQFVPGSSQNPGFAFTGLTFETQQRAGMPRLREGFRR